MGIYQNLIRIGLLITTTFVTFSKLKEVVLEEWETWKVQHGKEYRSEQENNFRMKVFMDNKAKMARHNTLAHQGQKSYTQKLNEYSDMLPAEFNQVMNGYKRPNQQQLLSLDGITQVLPAHVELPEKVDWRKYGAVTDVKNQGACGSCWAFSTTGALEGQHFRKTGKLVSLSEQNLLDCTAPLGEERCGGGNFDIAFTYIKENGGIDTEGDEDALKAAVATVGPVSVAIHASDSFKQYGEGIFDEEDCNGLVNHAVLVVGYGTNEEGDYWLVKNSW